MCDLSQFRAGENDERRNGMSESVMLKMSIKKKKKISE